MAARYFKVKYDFVNKWSQEQVVQEVVFFTNGNINLLGLIIQKSSGAIFLLPLKVILRSFNAGTVYFT